MHKWRDWLLLESWIAQVKERYMGRGAGSSVGAMLGAGCGVEVLIASVFFSVKYDSRLSAESKDRRGEGGGGRGRRCEIIIQESKRDSN